MTRSHADPEAIPSIHCDSNRLITIWKLKDGTPVTIRPILPADEPLMVRFHQTLSDRSVYLRYFTDFKLEQRVTHERLSHICHIEQDQEMVLVVERIDPETGDAKILGVGRLSKIFEKNEAEFALVVSDAWQGQGLGTHLLRNLIQEGRDEKLERITATILPENREMQHMAKKAGFVLHHDPFSPEIDATLIL